MTDTPPPIPPHILENLDTYRSAVGIARIITLGDLAAFTSLWTNLTTLEQTHVTIALATLYAQGIADCFVLAGHAEKGTVTSSQVADYYTNYLTELATAEGN